jgi:LacI family transcriptional regulator
LNDNPLINEETKKRVKRLAEEMGYERNELARGLVKGGIGAVGLIIPDITNPFFAEVTRGVEDAANERGYGIILCNTGGDLEKEKGYGRLLRRKRVDGLILTSVTVDDPYIADLVRSEVPLILVSRHHPGIDTSYIMVDDRKGGKMATSYLLKLGHRRIGFIGGPKNVISSQDRLQGYKEALYKRGIPLQQEIIRYAGFTRDAGYLVMKEYLKLKTDLKPTAIFAANDMIALGVIEAIEEEGLSVPDDISVIGYNNISYASLPRIMLTTIAQPMYDMGYTAAEYILDVVEGKRKGKLKDILEPQLVVRKTCRPLSSSWNGKLCRVE